MKIIRATERLLLREFVEEDVDLLVALDGDPEVMRYIHGPALDREGYRERLRSRFLPYYAQGQGHGYWAAIAKASNEFIGWFVARPAVDHTCAAALEFQPGEIEIGYRLRRASWGRGYATEGAKAIIHRAFSEFDARRLVACALIGNVASTRVMEKVGMKRVGLYPLPGIAEPAVKYALSKAELDAGDSAS